VLCAKEVIGNHKSINRRTDNVMARRKKRRKKTNNFPDVLAKILKPLWNRANLTSIFGSPQNTTLVSDVKLTLERRFYESSVKFVKPQIHKSKDRQCNGQAKKKEGKRQTIFWPLKIRCSRGIYNRLCTIENMSKMRTENIHPIALLSLTYRRCFVTKQS
jgi:hypothetical protein